VQAFECSLDFFVQGEGEGGHERPPEAGGRFRLPGLAAGSKGGRRPQHHASGSDQAGESSTTRQGASAAWFR
ncbi:MAG: hypothetical protein K6346_04575, partial [Halothiobacillaceae bacterium]